MNENLTGRPGWTLIANDGALFRGPGRGNPMEVWSPRSGWKPYSSAPKGVEWGTAISEEEAQAMMSEALQATRADDRA